MKIERRRWEKKIEDKKSYKEEKRRRFNNHRGREHFNVEDQRGKWSPLA